MYFKDIGYLATDTSPVKLSKILNTTTVTLRQACLLMCTPTI